MSIAPIPLGVKEFIDTYPSFYLIPHMEPDGDCIGSALALASWLRRRGKVVQLHNMGPFEKKDVRPYAPLFQGRISQGEGHKAEAAIVVDCSTLDRIGDLGDDIHGLPLLVIDHHSSGHPFGTHRYIDPQSPATSLLVQHLVEAHGDHLTEEEAWFCFFAFSTDTGFFRHLDSRASWVFPMVERMVQTGVSPKEMFYHLNSGASLEGRRHLGRLLARMESFAQDQVLLVWELLEETQAVGKKNRDSDLMYQILTGIEGAEVVVSLREDRKDFITVGLRSKHRVDVGALALGLGGGGHARAAGIGIQGSLSEVKDLVLSRLLPLI